MEHPDPASKGNTSNKKYYWPRRLISWEEFNFDALKAVFDGTLIREARQRGRSLPPYPTYIPEIDCVIYEETTSTSILTKWSHNIVTQALFAIKDTFHPCIWVQGKRRIKNIGKKNEQLDDSTSQDQSEKTKEQERSERPNSVSRNEASSPSKKKPDSGAISLCQLCNPLGALSPEEMLPKDYKTGSKWTSSVISDQLTDGNGEWKGGYIKHNNAMPIRQLYTYCVDYGCRYGCILTTEEVVIVRIKPLSQRKQPGKFFRSE